MDDCIFTGALVYLKDYHRYAVADIYKVGDARVVRFYRDPLSIPGGHHPASKPTHTLYLTGEQNFWRQAAGIAVVQEQELLEFNAVRDLGREL